MDILSTSGRSATPVLFPSQNVAHPSHHVGKWVSEMIVHSTPNGLRSPRSPRINSSDPSSSDHSSWYSDQDTDSSVIIRVPRRRRCRRRRPASVMSSEGPSSPVPISESDYYESFGLLSPSSQSEDAWSIGSADVYSEASPVLIHNRQRYQPLNIYSAPSRATPQSTQLASAHISSAPLEGSSQLTPVESEQAVPSSRRRRRRRRHAKRRHSRSESDQAHLQPDSPMDDSAPTGATRRYPSGIPVILQRPDSGCATRDVLGIRREGQLRPTAQEFVPFGPQSKCTPSSRLGTQPVPTVRRGPAACPPQTRSFGTSSHAVNTSQVHRGLLVNRDDPPPYDWNPARNNPVVNDPPCSHIIYQARPSFGAPRPGLSSTAENRLPTWPPSSRT